MSHFSRLLKSQIKQKNTQLTTEHIIIRTCLHQRRRRKKKWQFSTLKGKWFTKRNDYRTNGNWSKSRPINRFFHIRLVVNIGRIFLDLCSMFYHVQWISQEMWEVSLSDNVLFLYIRVDDHHLFLSREREGRKTMIDLCTWVRHNRMIEVRCFWFPQEED